MHQCCPCPSNFYWHNTLMYNNPFLNKTSGDTLRIHVRVKVVQVDDMKIRKIKAKVKLHFFLFHLKFVKMKKF